MPLQVVSPSQKNQPQEVVAIETVDNQQKELLSQITKSFGPFSAIRSCPTKSRIKYKESKLAMILVPKLWKIQTWYAFFHSPKEAKF